MRHAPRLRRTNALLITSGVLTAAALAVGAAGPVSAANAAGTAPTQSVAAASGGNYVALGDSYAGGFGVAPYSSGPAAGCFQSTTDYPHQVAASLGLQLDDRACAGATTGNISRVAQKTGAGSATAPVQADALSKNTDVVTVSIGGNDLGFAGVIANCVALDKAGPVFAEIHGKTYNHCKDYYAPVVHGVERDRLAARVRTVVAPRLAQTFRVIAQRRRRRCSSSATRCSRPARRRPRRDASRASSVTPDSSRRSRRTRSPSPRPTPLTSTAPRTRSTERSRLRRRLVGSPTSRRSRALLRTPPALRRARHGCRDSP
ncbi:SGNH/GDSL hydrolase family protein [Curtobacterium flaccumfaciens]|nr:SGNH/GDSL hydrolase family protein [Curtobacterium flaccumfaciens]